MPKGEKEVSADLRGNNITSLDGFLNSRYGQPYYNPGGSSPSQLADRNRKREILSVLMNYLNRGNKRGLDLVFAAFNYDDPGFEIKINGKEPKIYNTNVVYSNMVIEFKKGDKVEIPTGVLEAYISGGEEKVDYFSDGYKNGFRMHASGDADFVINILPELDISVEELGIYWNPLDSSYSKYAAPQPNPGSLRGNYKFYIYNNSLKDWEETGMHHRLDKDASSYIDDENNVRLRINIPEGSQVFGESMEMPQIELRGEAK